LGPSPHPFTKIQTLMKRQSLTPEGTKHGFIGLACNKKHSYQNYWILEPK
jgi:hypothetical protein